MTLTFHTCKGNLKQPHKPEINWKVTSLKEAKGISLRHKDKNIYVNWQRPNAYIIKNGIISYRRKQNIKE